MKQTWQKKLYQGGAIAFFCLLFTCCAAIGAELENRKVETFQDIPPDQAASVLAQLGDEEIRRLVLAELARPAGDVEVPHKTGGLNSLISQWLRALDEDEETIFISGRLLSAYPHLSSQVVQILAKIGDGNIATQINSLLIILGALMVGGGAEWYVHHLAGKLKKRSSPEREEIEGGGIGDGIMQLLPEGTRLAVFTFTSLLVFLVFNVNDPTIRATFMAVLLAIVLARGLSLIAFLLCWPGKALFRILPMEDKLAASIYRAVRMLAWYVAGALMFRALIQELGAEPQTLDTLTSLLGTILFILIAVRITMQRKAITQALLTPGKKGFVSWTRLNLATFWPFLAFLYLFIVWLIWIFALATGEGRDNGALFISLLILPIYLIFDRIGQWLVDNIINVLGINRMLSKQSMGGAYEENNAPTPEERESRLRHIITNVYRSFIGMVLVLWLLYLWNLHIPFAGALVKAVFDIIVTLFLALLFWRFISRFIERKLAAMEPKQDEKQNQDEEFGPAIQRGRSYTLLPILRKFIASALLVITGLIILSSIGVEITPLLAGAGVVGLAIGFGAQKTVSDVLSGLFFLFDDAFRVGEYIQAGSVVGTVEGISLRNVMLRHHRGMLQIVPHSELGTITNFMRGGIVVKFNLEFPSSVNVDMVRKIIKKVGQAMLEDPEMGSDFILPLKSQGVNEITNSILVIRVKFTAKPGRQFLIRREAYRRITEALAAKGIHYAVRKVIVEVPQDNNGNPPSSEQIRKGVEAAAAEGAFDETAENNKKEEKETSIGMPGM